MTNAFKTCRLDVNNKKMNPDQTEFLLIGSGVQREYYVFQQDFCTCNRRGPWCSG